MLRLLLVFFLFIFQPSSLLYAQGLTALSDSPVIQQESLASAMAPLLRTNAAPYNGAIFLQLTATSDTAEVIMLHRRFLRTLKYSYGEGEPMNVYSFSGLRFNSDFDRLLMQDPAARRVARRALPYSALALAGSVTMVVIPLQMLLDTIRDASRVSRGEFVGTGAGMGEVLFLLAGSATTVIASRLSYKHLKRGVQMFNANHRGERIPITTSASQDHSGAAQPSDASSFGLKLGYTSSNLGGDHSLNTTSTSSFALGGYYERPLGLGLRLHTELLFIKKGFNINGQDLSYSFHYLEAPLLVKVRVPFFSQLRPSVLIGPAVGLKLSANASFNGESFPLKDGYKSVDVGLTAGLGAQLGQSPISVDLRYNAGLTSIRSNDDRSFKNRAFTLSMGYAF